ncbi:MAG: YiiX/YebB-like N1pC/P60 family cysteine hydrolase [Smithellaceae bacterium]
MQNIDDEPQMNVAKDYRRSMRRTFMLKHHAFILMAAILSMLSALLFPASAWADESQPDRMSICNRTGQVRAAIQKEIDAVRFSAGKPGTEHCHGIKTSDLKKIKSLHIVGKDISSLKAGDFEGLEGLLTLDLEGNVLETLDFAAFSGLMNLENLFVAQNPIRTIKGDLGILPRLKRLDCSGGRISSLPPQAFFGNPQLEAVFLSGNQLTKLPDHLFAHNPSLKIVDLSDNRLTGLPPSFVAEKNVLQSLDLSQNKITTLAPEAFTNLKALRALNLADNPLAVIHSQSDLQNILNSSGAVFTQERKRPKTDRNGSDDLSSSIFEPHSPVYTGIERIRSFVRDNWHVPLDIRVSFSAPDSGAYENPGQRAREERLLLRQLEEVRDAYRRAAFDFFAVDIHFVPPESPRNTPAVYFNKNNIGIEIVMRAPAGAFTSASVISDERILETLADHFSRSRSIAWYTRETTENLEAALKRDFKKIARMDDELRFDNIRMEDLIDTATQRMDEAGGKSFFSETELTYARLIQFRILLTFQRLENTMARWRHAEDDPDFAYRMEVRLLLAQASGMYRTYLDWFLNTVVGGRATLNVLDETWYRRNPIFRILDSEVPAGFFNLDGRISTRIPDGAVRDLLKSRLSAPLLHFLYGMRSLDKKVTQADIHKSPLRAEMTQALGRIASNRRALREHRISDMRAFKELWEAKVKDGVKFPLYRVTMSVASIIGDTRFSHPSPAITPQQLEDMKTILKPGDLLVSRTDYYLSNAFLGGFWPHGILYLGPKEAWSHLRLADGTILAEDPWIYKNILPNYVSQKDDFPALVMEAISEGVVFNSLEEAARKDYLVIFRPKFTPEEQETKIAQAISRALKYHGRPYDFDFDFFTDDKLVCTELLYRAYHPDINFLIQKQAALKPRPPVPGMVKKAGRDTMPAGEIVKLALYMLENKIPNPAIGYGGQTLEFVRLYMKQGVGKPAQILEGPEGLQALKLTLRSSDAQ